VLLPDLIMITYRLGHDFYENLGYQLWIEAVVCAQRPQRPQFLCLPAGIDGIQSIASLEPAHVMSEIKALRQ